MKHKLKDWGESVKQIKYLGHLISHDTIQIDTRNKVYAIRDYPLPNSLRQSRRFLCVCGWHWQFVRDFVSLFAILTDTLKKKKLLHSPDFTSSFSIQYDASQFGVVAVLGQRKENEQEVSITYVSHKLNSTQKIYSVLECLVAYYANKKFRAYAYVPKGLAWSIG